MAMKPEQRLGRFQCLQIMKNPVLKLPVRENVFGSQPNPVPVTRQLPRNHLSLPAREDVLGTQRDRWDRLVVVVGGVTSTQGARESRVQGEEPETWPFKATTHTEVLDLYVGWCWQLEHLKYSLEKGPCWKAGCSVELPVRFGGGWAETYIRKDATRRPSTLCHYVPSIWRRYLYTKGVTGSR